MRKDQQHDFHNLNTLQNQHFKEIQLQEIFPIVESSLEDNRKWISDFGNDKLFISNDLHDIVSAYQHFYGKIRQQ